MKSYILSIILFITLQSCTAQHQENNRDPKTMGKVGNDYWHSGEAEITSFKLSQARYGEIHEGTAAMIFVTEPFSPKKYVKVDQTSKGDISVLKLNFTKNFNTGIYPYSMMNSTFFPFYEGHHSLKISSSSQEWCGHTYMEMVNKNKFEFVINSYFEGETEKGINIEKNFLEDDIWTQIRLQPDHLPEGTIDIIPSFFFLRLTHAPLKSYEAKANLMVGDATNRYSLEYPELNRKLTIAFENFFPYRIISWEDEHFSGYGTNRKVLKTTAERIETIKSDYWRRNGNKDKPLRKKLGLQ